MKTLYERKSLAPNDFRKIEAQGEVAAERCTEAREGTRAAESASASPIRTGAAPKTNSR
jgi:hypothetical protein